ncbi:Udp-n-acetylglucosamine transferase subunit, partial [Globisporangium splendens]
MQQQMLRRPPALKVGDTIAFVAPASGLAALAPHRLQQAKDFLESAGFKVKIYPSVSRTPKQNMRVLRASSVASGRIDDSEAGGIEVMGFYSSADAQTRAEELVDAFEDPEVKAIICTIGGLTSHEMLEYLDFDRIREHPKIFSGFSDITTLHLAFYAKTRLCSFYGPSAVCQFGEFPQPLSYTMEYFWKAVAATDPIGAIVPSLEWTDDKTANWLTKADMTYMDKMKPNAGYVWLREGKAQGRILGGCLPTMLNVRGTEYMPDLTGAVLLLETPEGHEFDKGMPLDEANAVLGCLRLDGTFKRISGLVVGRAFAYTDAQVAELQRLIMYHTRDTAFPILYGVDTGHTNPIVTIPLGCQVALDSTAEAEAAFTILESGVQA